MIFKDFIGMKVIYRSGSNKEYEAIITAIPEKPENRTEYPTVSLYFFNNRGKAVRKERVLPIGAGNSKTQVWIYKEGKYLIKNGVFVDE